MNYREAPPGQAGVAKYVWGSLPWLIGLLAAGLALYAAAPYGPGIGADSLDYLSTAESLLRGEGFIDLSGEFYRLWPPLYPMLLALVSWLSSAPVAQAARWLNALSFGLAVALGGTLLQRAFPGRPLYGALTSLLVLCMPSFFSLGVIVCADISFIALCWAFLLAGSAYLRRPTWSSLLVMVALAAPAAVLRWHGATLVISGAVFIAWRQRRSPGAMRLQALAFGAAASLPFFAWVLGRNFRLFGDFFGPRASSPVLVGQNLLDAWQRMGRWFLPLSLTERIPQAVFTLAALALLAWLMRRGGWRALRSTLSTPEMLPALFFAPLYLTFDLLTRVPGDHPEWFDDRYYLPVFVCIVMLGAALVELLASRLQPRPGRRTLSLAVAVLGLLWLSYPVYQGWELVSKTRRGEQALYNIYNTPDYRATQIAELLQKGEIPAGAVIYSNHAGLVYYFSGRGALRSPRDPYNYEADEQVVGRLFQGWPGQAQAYLVWWKPNYYNNFFTPTRRERVAELQLLLNSKEADLYLVTPR